MPLAACGEAETVLFGYTASWAYRTGNIGASGARNGIRTRCVDPWQLFRVGVAVGILVVLWGSGQASRLGSPLRLLLVFFFGRCICSD